MIAFDKKTFRTLKKIYKSGDNGMIWGNLRKNFDDGLHELLLLLNKEEYIAIQDEHGKWLPCTHHSPTKDNFRAFCTPKGREFVEQREVTFRRWIVPTIISICALVISIITLLYAIFGNSVIKVILL